MLRTRARTIVIDSHHDALRAELGWGERDLHALESLAGLHRGELHAADEPA